MIQRQQTIWLLIAAVFTFLGMTYPFYTGTRVVNATLNETVDLDGAGAFSLLIISIFLLGIIVVSIFLFKTRKTQMQVVIAGLIFSLGLIFFYFKEMQRFANGHITLTSLFTFAIPILLFLAIRGIRKDNKLVRSLDKLR
jgi:hypothetical protein